MQKSRKLRIILYLAHNEGKSSGHICGFKNQKWKKSAERTLRLSLKSKIWDCDFCDAETREHAQMRREKFGSSTPSLNIKKSWSKRFFSLMSRIILKVSGQSNKNCRLWIDLRISRGATTPRHSKGNRRTRRWSGLMASIIFTLNKFQLNRIKSVGGESIWRFQDAHPTAPPGR